jgi:hypothetical protein
VIELLRRTKLEIDGESVLTLGGISDVFISGNPETTLKF